MDASQDVSVRTGSKLENLVTNIEREMTEGVEGIKCGIVGEVGCSYPLTGGEPDGTKFEAFFYFFTCWKKNNFRIENIYIGCPRYISLTHI